MKKLKILFEDKNILIVYKDGNIPTINSEKYSKSLYNEVYDYLHKKNQRVFIVHRLDKDTSGLVLFAKNEKVKYDLQRNWQNVERKYYAVVSGKLNEKNGTLKDFLYETKGLDVVVTNIKKIGKLAITNFNVIENNNKYSLLDINIETGRRNQIRVQLANIGHPIIGDKKYGKVKYKRMMLEAYYLKFVHPVTKKVCYAELPLNNDFEKLF